MCAREGLGVEEKYTNIGSVQEEFPGTYLFTYSTVTIGSFTQTLLYIAQYFILFRDLV